MIKNWKAIIIEDEELARKRLKRLLKPYEDFVEVIGEAANGAEGLEMISKINPGLIFLDVEMPVLNGFEMLSKLKEQPKVIFTTAYDQYAIKAFEEDSIDYLLKPIEAERLEKAMKKLQQLRSIPETNLPIDALLRQLNLKKDVKTLTVKIGDRILLIKLEDIVFIEAEDKYVFLHCRDGKNHLTDFTLASLEEKLPDFFLRIHRGTMINVNFIKEIRKGFNGSLVFVMDNPENAKLSSSRGYGEVLRDRFDI